MVNVEKAPEHISDHHHSQISMTNDQKTNQIPSKCIPRHVHVLDGPHIQGVSGKGMWPCCCVGARMEEEKDGRGGSSEGAMTKEGGKESRVDRGAGKVNAIGGSDIAWEGVGM